MKSVSESELVMSGATLPRRAGQPGRRASASIAAACLVAVGLASSAAWASYPLPAANTRASGCELFVDKLTVSLSSHSLHSVQAYVKVQPEAFGQPIKAVGFYGRKTGREYRGGEMIAVDLPWGDSLTGTRFEGSPDYFKVSFPLGHDWASYTYEGTFYVELMNNDRVWLNPDRATPHTRGQNFFIDSNLFASVYSMRIPSDRLENAVATQEHFTELNPRGCR